MTNIFRSIALQLSQVLIRLAMEGAVKKALPKIFDDIDLTVPQLQGQGAGPIQLQSVITDAIESRTGRVTTPTQIGAVLGLYDPVKGAKKTRNRRNRKP